MTKHEYGELLKDPRWQKKRLEIFERDGWRCVMCNAGGDTLHVHHRRYVAGAPWDVDDNDLHTLCDGCHTMFHGKSDRSGRLDVRSLRERIREQPMSERVRLSRDVRAVAAKVAEYKRSAAEAMPGGLVQMFASQHLPEMEADLARLQAELDALPDE